MENVTTHNEAYPINSSFALKKQATNFTARLNDKIVLGVPQVEGDNVLGVR